MKTPHPSYERLIKGLQLVKAIPESGWRPTDLQQTLNISAQRANNWVDRGVSQEGAADVQKRFGIDLHWILSGTGEPLATSVVVQADNWPFKKISKAEFDDMEEWKKLYIEDVVVRLIGEMGTAFEQIEARAIAGARNYRKSSNGK